jgi:ribosomal protein L34E
MRCTVQDIFAWHFDAYRKTHRMPFQQAKAASALRQCRTAALGGHVRRCEHGHIDGVWYNSCRHRSCPQCNALANERWLERQRARLLSCSHRHIVFTIPSELRVLLRFNETVLTDALFSSVHQSMVTLLKDPRYLGATPGLVLARHTWGRNLSYHPHVHCLVSEGGLDERGQWCRPKRASILLPAKVLMAMYRGKLRAKILALLDAGQLRLPAHMSPQRLGNVLNKLGRTPWHVYIAERYAHGQGVAVYLARYVRGGPLSNGQLSANADGRITVHYTRHRRDAQGQRRAKLNLDAMHFIARYLAHVPAHRQRTVRSYGLYASGCKAKLDVARQALGQRPAEVPEPVQWTAYIERHHPHSMRCSQCGAPIQMGPRIVANRGPP